MKKSTIHTLALFLFTFYLNAQGNLQFNQVKLVSNQETVPVGKVWKIESILYSQTISHIDIGNNQSLSNDAVISINSSNFTVRSVRQLNGMNGGGKSGFSWDNTLPIWLPGNTTLASGTGVSFISIIEFNIIP